MNVCKSAFKYVRTCMYVNLYVRMYTVYVCMKTLLIKIFYSPPMEITLTLGNSMHGIILLVISENVNRIGKYKPI